MPFQLDLSTDNPLNVNQTSDFSLDRGFRSSETAPESVVRQPDPSRRSNESSDDFISIADFSIEDIFALNGSSLPLSSIICRVT